MLKLEKTFICNWEGALRGMRNPMNSWDRSDTDFDKADFIYVGHDDSVVSAPVIGPNDLELMKKLAAGGPVHAKYRRQIFVSVDITAPLYWWKEFDTYKVGTTANSCSTMHKIHSKEFTLEDFSHEHLIDEGENSWLWAFNAFLIGLNSARKLYLETKDKKYWWQMIQSLPTSYNQKRTVTLDYENLVNIHKWRRHHKLDEWHTFCDWIESLPYAKDVIFVEETSSAE